MAVPVSLPPPTASERTASAASNETTHSIDTIDLEKGTQTPPQPVPPVALESALPPKRSRLKRAWALPVFSTHRRLIAVMVIINLILLTCTLIFRWWETLPYLSILVLANITVAITVRQQQNVNLLFTLATATKTMFPLPVRWALGKIYHFGGLHSGASVAATIWMVLFTVDATYLRAVNAIPGPSELTVFLTYAIDLLLFVIVILALPKFRSRHHNTFEVTHRFLGWTVILFVWLHTIFLIRDFRGDKSHARAFFTNPAPYNLIVLTITVALPWFRLRKVPVEITKPSNHAIVMRFADGVRSTFAGSSSSISVSPLYEWHSFANIPKPGESGFRLIISRAGDWTSQIIDNPPTHVWIKGIALAGVANIEVLFHSVLYVCTGSGIGPVLPHLLAKQVPSRLFWSTRTPVTTYGQELVDEIMEASPDAVVHDTNLHGKPDMLATSHQLVKESGAEAVIVISNQKLTRKIVYGLESRGIPAFGAIWDS